MTSSHPRVHASILVATLSCLALIAATAGAPTLTVSDVLALDQEGAVRVTGHLVSLWAYESGTEKLVLADATGAGTVTVLCVRGPGTPPSSRAGFGDLLAIQGYLKPSPQPPTIFSDYNGLTVLDRSRDALSVGMLYDLWPMLIGDAIEISGLCYADDSGGFRLMDASSESSIALRSLAGSELAPGTVTIDARLQVDRASMALVLDVRSVLDSP